MVVSQKTIAKQLKLSESTVSRSLSMDPRIPHETRSKVLTLAAKTGYRPKIKRELNTYPINLGDISATGASSIMLAAFIQADDFRSSENAYKTIGGMSKAAQEMNVSLILHAVPLGKRDAIHLPENQPELMRMGKMQGVILLHEYGYEAIRRLAAQTQCVSITFFHPDIHMDCVGEENSEPIARIVGHLAGLGHRKIGYIDEGLSASFYTERLSGYIQGLLKFGLDYYPENILRWNEAAGESVPLEILHQWIQKGVTALVCPGDAMAIQVFRWLRDNGYDCPRQVSVTGFDAFTLPADVPPLTTVRVHFQDLGHLAVERLIARIKNPTLPTTRVLVECELVEGKTTGPAPAEG
jgi:LacI family transcriptional regulator